VPSGIDAGAPGCQNKKGSFQFGGCLFCCVKILGAETVVIKNWGILTQFF
jgi:radical SAM superfamily enzyme